MIKEATQEPDDTFTINGKIISKLICYGLIKNKSDKTTSLTITMDDGTDIMEATKWIDSEESNSSHLQRLSIIEGSYVCVNGVIKCFADKRYISAFNIRVITNHNEITHHFLDVIFNHLQITQGNMRKLHEPNGITNGITNGLTTNGSNHYSNYPSNGNGNRNGNRNKNSNPNSYSSTVSSFNMTNQLSQLSQSSQNNNIFNNHQQMVLEAYSKDDGSENGMSIAEVTKRLAKSGLSVSDVRRATDFLVQEGHVYSTIDDNHFKSTEEF